MEDDRPVQTFLRRRVGTVSLAVLLLVVFYVVERHIVEAHGQAVWMEWFVLQPTWYLSPGIASLSALLVSPFAHTSVVHLAWTLVPLVAFGPAVERRLGTTRFVALVGLVGILAGAAKVLLQGEPSIGGSRYTGTLVVAWAVVPDGLPGVLDRVPASTATVEPVLMAAVPAGLFAWELYQVVAGRPNVAHLVGLAAGVVVAAGIVLRGRSKPRGGVGA